MTSDLPDWLAEPAAKRTVRESTTEQRFVEWCKTVRLRQWKLQGKGRSGYPDRTVFLGGGRTCTIEFKRKKKKAQSHQSRVHDELREDGIPVLVTDSFEEAVAWVESLKNGSP